MIGRPALALTLALAALGCGTTVAAPDLAAPDDAGLDLSVAFDPSALGGALVLWLDAARGFAAADGGAASWADRSRYGASADGVATLRAGAVGGYDAVELASPAPRLQIASAPQLWLGDDDFVIAAVVVVDNPTGAAGAPIYFWNKATLAGLVNRYYDDGVLFGVDFDPAAPSNTTPSFRLQRGTAPASEILTFAGADGRQLTPDAPHLVVARRFGSAGNQTLELRVDGARTTRMVTPHSVDEVAVAVLIGAAPGEAATFGGRLDVAELLVVGKAGPIDDAEVAAIESYLATKYALP
jgi:hypothetical protein